MVSKVSILLELCVAFSVDFIVEQPLSSVMWEHPRMRQVVTKLGNRIMYCNTYMGAFLGETEKAMKLYGTASYLGKLERKLEDVPETSKKLVERSKTHDGKPAVTGNADLKASQAYPMKFALLVAKAFVKGFVPALRDPYTVTLDGDDLQALSSELPLPPES